MSGWSLVLASGNSALPATWQEQSDLTSASGKRISVYLDQAHEISFTMPGGHPEVPLVEELLSDVIAVYDPGDGTPPMREVRCRVGPSTDAGDGTQVTTTFRALAYKEILNRAFIPFDTTYAESFSDSRGIEGVGWAMINQYLTRPSGSLSITRGTAGADTATVYGNPAVRVDAGAVVAESVDRVFEGSNCWWEITGDLVYQTYRKGARRRFLLDYGGSVASFTRTVDPSTFANDVHLFGGTPSSPPVGYIVPETGYFTPTVANGTAVMGRWEKYVYDSEEYSQKRAQARAAALLETSQIITPTYTFVLKPGMWNGPDDLWIGDVTPVRIQAGRLDVDTQLVVSSMIFDIGDDGEETVTVTCDGLNQRDAYYIKQRKQLIRLDRLERR